MLNKSQIAARLEGMDLGKKRQISNILDGLAELAREEIGAGEDFTVPGIARVSYRYTSPRKKGETYVGFGGVEQKAETARPEKIRLAASPLGAIKQLLPKKGTKSYKAVVTRKGKR